MMMFRMLTGYGGLFFWFVRSCLSVHCAFFSIPVQIDIPTELSRKLLVRFRNLAMLYMVKVGVTRRAPPDNSAVIIKGTGERVKKAEDLIRIWVRFAFDVVLTVGVIAVLCHSRVLGG